MGASASWSNDPRPRPPGSARLTTLPAQDDAAIVHLLARATFGPRAGDIDRVRAEGAAAWLERQLDPRRIDDTAAEATLAGMKTLAMPTDALLREFPRPDPTTRQKIQSGEMTRAELMAMYPREKRPGRIIGELQAAKIARAVLSERQLEEVMVDFWFNHFNVYALKGDGRWYVTAYERDAIRPHALGRFRDLVRATARHPAMLVYLDNWLSSRADFTVPIGPNRGRRAGLNENYARELLELHTLGVDGGYTQQDVREVARAFTGWTIDRPRVNGTFVYRAMMHDRGAKTVLGHRIAAGGGESDGERVIDLVTRHPSTSRFIATKLARRFVADEPPGPLVERVAAAFRATGGDVRAMLRAIFSAPEFWAPEARRAKIKKPFEFVASATRALGGRLDGAGAYALARAVADIGEPLYEAQPPTGHPDRADAWVSTGALLARMNFALALAQHRFRGVRVTGGATAADGARQRPDEVLDRVLASVLHGAATPETRAVLTAQLGDRERADVETLTALVLGSPEFQRR
ncbi:MAG: DUF1800 domain-containing protein [Candidatus Rokubacteria bacterium]|nr:DUF1800 domain-containing protein [Candidatus Rokubacteria bacterium]